MSKKFIFSIVVFAAFIFSFTYVFAADMANGVQNVVNKTEETVEGVVKDGANAVRDVTKDAENTANNAGNAMAGAVSNTTNHAGNTAAGMTNEGNYTATRTATNEGATFMGMNATTWTWLILGIAAIAIVALVWYYSMQFNDRSYDNRGE